MRYLVVKNIGELVTMKGSNGLRTGKAMNEVQFLHDAYLVAENGKFIEAGTGLGYQKYCDDAFVVDADQKLVTPGLIDSHTHLVHAGSREHELAMKLAGYSYLEILKQGGGILNTVNHTVKASFDELVDQAQKTLNRMLLHGTTVVEAKSGYGLELSTEVKQLEVARFLDQKHPVKIVNTFMGAHAIPPQYQNDRPKFLALLKEMTEEVKKQNLAEFCDAFCEDGVFSLAETKEILTYAKSLGLGIKMHADEIVPMGGAALAQELGCISADHLMATTESDMERLAQSGTVANLLPLTSFYLNSDYAKARLMIEKGCGVAIATDYNPGSSPCENLQLAMQVACLKMKMTPKEVITAATINAAVSLGLEKTKGSIGAGKDADFVIFDCPNLDYLIYHFGINHVEDVFISGKQVVSKGKIIGE
ncbi:MAG TPA: imidazolonepropionase [Bacilli bacterium]|nr:MAG: Imidazolonepropionase [Tenericutes bacterium ADurb.Bin140]HOE77740.1 imidazolonepropionase [Bacilli bacterium]HPK58664.1 imidazolonepropionase [Bacilli bacterium]HRU49042.1 imidazolonepropionase [Bacilli bacterium]